MHIDAQNQYCPKCFKTQKDIWLGVSSLTGSKRKGSNQKKGTRKRSRTAKLPTTPQKPENNKNSSVTPPLPKYKVDDWVYAAWNDDPKNKTWLAQVISINPDNTYKLFYSDGDVRDNVPCKEMRKPTKRQTTDKMVGKRFFDEGDDNVDQPKKKRIRTSTRFKKGEFFVFLKGISKPKEEPVYWCERETFGKLNEERQVEKFCLSYIEKLIKQYDNE